MTEANQDIEGMQFEYTLKNIFNKLFTEELPIIQKPVETLHWDLLETPIGTMLAIANNYNLYLLEFAERNRLESKIRHLRVLTKASINYGSTKITGMIEKELMDYFAGKINAFKTPVKMLGSNFQQAAWHELRKIPYGETKSYMNQAEGAGNGSAYRAVANANATNRLAIIIPCHRVINNNGKLGGYDGGLWRKKWLLEHEQNFKNNTF